jgi:hypothetical protein
MKRTFPLWQALGFGITTLLGTILHFLYDWTGENFLIAPFAAVNESTWEHMKLLFWPMLAYTAVQSFFFRERKDFLCIKLRGILLGLALIPVIFYTYNGVIGKSPDWLNIAIFFVCAGIAYIYEAGLFKRNEIRCKNPALAIAILSFIALCFIVFTFAAPEIGIFRDPLTGKYGI